MAHLTTSSGNTKCSGGCLCGAVRYEVVGPLRPVVYCHCSQCRRTTGHFLAATAAAKDELVIASDADLCWFASSESASRGFCGRCGSSLFWVSEAEDYICIMVGSLDDPGGIEAVEHVFVDDKPDYYQLNDDLPKHPGGDSQGYWFRGSR